MQFLKNHWKELKSLFIKKLQNNFVVLSIISGLFAQVHADGLPGEFLLSSRWHDLMWQHSPLTNPAFLTGEEFGTIRLAYAPVLQGEFMLWEAGVTLPVGLHQSVGVSAIGENDGVIHGSTFDDSTGRLITNEATSSNTNVFTMLTYAVLLGEKLSLGANLNIAYQSNFGDALMGTGFDVGCFYKLLHATRAGDHSVGLSTVNLVSPSMSSSLVPRLGNYGTYSRDIRISWVGSFPLKSLESGFDIDLKDLFTNSDAFTNKQIEWGGAWRLGITLLPMFPVYVQMGFDNKIIEYWGLAAGIRLPLGTNGRMVSTMYQYNIKTEGDWASSHTIYLVTNFGKHRQKLETQPKPEPPARDTGFAGVLDSLRKIKGITIEEEKEFVRITAAEVAIHFVSGSSNLPPEAIKALQEIARFLDKFPTFSVSIEGHTDSDPIVGRLKERYPDNKALSKARAEKVKDYFVETEKLPARLFTTIGWGESKPITTNDTEEGKSINRRVVIIVKTK